MKKNKAAEEDREGQGWRVAIRYSEKALGDKFEQCGPPQKNPYLEGLVVAKWAQI